MSSFTEPLIVSPLPDGKTWRLVSPFKYFVGYEGSDDIINVPVNFLTDFASVPRFLWWLLPKWGKYGNAAVIHDWLYKTHSRSRHDADHVFLEAMKVASCSWLTRHVMFYAVRIFGWLAWYG